MGTESALGEQRMERYVWAQLVRTNPKATQRKLYDAYISRLKVLSAVNAGSMEQLVLAELSRFADELKLFLWIDDPDGTASSLEDDEGVLPQAILNLLRGDVFVGQSGAPPPNTGASEPLRTGESERVLDLQGS